MIRVGLIGAGFIGRNHFNQYERLADRARVVALCDKEAKRRAGDWSGIGGNIGDKKGAKRDLGDITPYTDWRAIVDDDRVDLVDICCPTLLHKEIAIAALATNKHVLCEKPMALTLTECDAMLEAANESAGKLMIAHCIRFWPEYAWLRQSVRDQPFGPCRSLQLRRHAEAPSHSLNNWLNNPELSGGALMDLHIHDVDFVQQLFGKPASIHAQGIGQGGGIDRIHALWHYDDGPIVQLEGCWDMPTGFGFNMGFTALFEQAAVVWDLAANTPLTIYRDGQEPQQPNIPSATDGYYHEIDYFLKSIETDEAPALCLPQESRDAVATALAEKQVIDEHATTCF